MFFLYFLVFSMLVLFFLCLESVYKACKDFDSRLRRLEVEFNER